MTLLVPPLPKRGGKEVIKIVDPQYTVSVAVMSSPKSPSQMPMPAYDISPATVQFMAKYYAELCSPIRKVPPSSPKTPARAYVSPGDRLFSSPTTEEYIILKHMELFGPSPVPNLLSPLPVSPIASSVNKPPSPEYPNGITAIGYKGPLSERPMLMNGPYPVLPRPRTTFIGPIQARHTRAALRKINGPFRMELGDEVIRMTKREALARGLLVHLKQ